MSESTIRRIVHDAYEQEAAVHCDAGLYSDERIRSFFAEIKNIVNECFQSLYDMVQHEYSDPTERRQRLAKGLAFIAGEDNQRMSSDEIARATALYPSIAQEYCRAMVRFAQCISTNRHAAMKMQIPSFDSFLFNLYKRVASSMELRTGRYFTTMSYLEQEIFLKDMMRITMSASITLHETQEQETPGRTHRSVMPSDSVSNIAAGSSHRTAPSANSVLSRAVSAARDADDKSLTEFSLRAHNTRWSSSRRSETGRTTGSRRAFGAPSVVKSRVSVRSTREEREIDTGDEPSPPCGTGASTGAHDQFFSSTAEYEDDDGNASDLDYA